MAERLRHDAIRETGHHQRRFALDRALTLFPNWGDPIAFASVGLSVLFALLAAQQGSKWWLTIPGIIVTGFGLLLSNGRDFEGSTRSNTLRCNMDTTKLVVGQKVWLRCGGLLGEPTEPTEATVTEIGECVTLELQLHDGRWGVVFKNGEQWGGIWIVTNEGLAKYEWDRRFKAVFEERGAHEATQVHKRQRIKSALGLPPEDGKDRHR